MAETAQDGTSTRPRNIQGTGCDTDARLVREVLDTVGDKWSTYVIAILDRGTMRFTELRRAIDGISQRMLTVTLRNLERDGLVERRVFPVVPPRVEYRLTPLGLSLLDVVGGLMRWSSGHTAEIDAARTRYDARTLSQA
jgi:DNA-binding HxlR family transcriptional regulator